MKRSSARQFLRAGQEGHILLPASLRATGDGRRVALGSDDSILGRTILAVPSGASRASGRAARDR